MKKLLLLMCCILMTGLSASAQNTTIEGVVTVAGGNEALPYVTVAVKDGTQGVTTDTEGRYSITVPQNSTLVFSFVGYVTKEVALKPSVTKVDVTLEEDAQMLDAVVAVGYGTMKRSDVTGAVSSVSSDMLKKAPVATIDQAMQGRVAGVTVNSGSGQPGAAAQVRVRGIGTIGDSAPIYVVDGVITDNISFVNANDIESLEVLKDASSTAIYGSRGANGVIIVTTKSGGKEKVNVSFEAYVGIQNRWRKLDLMNAEEQARTEVQIDGRPSILRLYNEQGINGWLRQEKLGAPFYPVNLDYSKIDTDWQDEVFRKNAVIQNYHVSVDGGTERAQYSLSAGYFGQEGTIRASFYNRLTLRANASYKIAKWLRVGTNVNYITSKNRDAANNMQYSGVLSAATRMAPWDPVRYPEGSVNSLGENLGGQLAASSNYRNLYNPIGMTEYSHPRNREQRWIGNIYLEITPIKDLVFRSSVNANLLTTQNRSFSEAYYISDYDSRTENFLSSSMGRYNDLFFENTLTYSKIFNGKHNFSAMIGTTTEEYDYYSIGGSGGSILNPTKTNWYLSQTTENRNYASDGAGRTRRLSFLGRIFYSYDERYLFTVNFRADGSSKFPENTWGFFPSAAFAWRLSEESFLKGNRTLDNLKLRLGWGQIGNDKIDESCFSMIMANNGPYFLDYVLGTNQDLATGATVETFVNNGGRWEFSEQWNVGVDFGLWGNKLYGNVDAYIRDTKDMLLQVTTPAHVGNRFYPQANVGTVRNQGIELLLGHSNTVGGFTYDISGNVSFVRNRLTHLNGGARILDPGTNQLIDEGYTLFTFWGYKFEGIYRTDEEVREHQYNAKSITEYAGDARYADINGDGIIDDNDKTDLGNPFPWLTYGLNASFRWKGIDLSLFFQGVYGNKIYNAMRNITEGDGSQATLSTSMRNVWSTSNPNGTIPNPSASGSTRNKDFSSRLVEDGSYLRLKNIQLGYTLPQHITMKAHISRLRFYVSVSNAFTVTGYTGYDPEVGSGVDWGNYPQSRTVLFGTNINF